VEPIREYIASGRPFLGICMGLQVLFSLSEEGGEHPCLDILPGRVRRLPDGLKVPHMGWNRVRQRCRHPIFDGISDGLKVPHMGWNRVRQRCRHPIFDGISDGALFYFVHSYYAHPEEPSVVIGETDYGVTFPAVVAKDNIVATQFHPEKSAESGLRLYENFLRMPKAPTLG